MNAGAQAFIEAVNAFIFCSDPPEKADVIFVPGSSEAEHALHAAELYKAGYAPYVLPSGRYPITLGHLDVIPMALHAAYPGDYPTEWAFIRHILMASGVPKKAILQEDQIGRAHV